MIVPNQNSTASATDAPAELAQLVTQAEQAGASDLHLHARTGGVSVSFRLDGVMQPITSLEDELGSRVLGRIKYLAKLKTYQDQLPQDGRIDRQDLGSKADVRVATYPTVTGEKIVLRLFREADLPELSSLGLETDLLGTLTAFLRQPSGLLLLTGPAGSGKTTTIYACLNEIRQYGGRHIITVEDPVEQVLPGIMQTEINEARGLNFAEATRHLLRQDPQVLALGEIRDDETAQLAVRAALTGHLVLSTLHAGSCRGVLERLLTMCPDRFAVAASVGLVINQRLLRRCCPACAGRGCAECLHTGYRGRVPVLESLAPTPAQRLQLRDRNLDGIQPGRSLAQAAETLCARGLTNVAECQRVLGT